MADCAQGATYQVRNRTDKRQRLSILTDVSAYFSPAEMSAVMGPSGSGAPSSKSRCLHVANLLHKVCEPVSKFQFSRACVTKGCCALAQAQTVLIRVSVALCSRTFSLRGHLLLLLPRCLLRGNQGGSRHLGAAGLGGGTLDDL